MSVVVIRTLSIRPNKKKNMFIVRNSQKKGGCGRLFFFFFFFFGHLDIDNLPLNDAINQCITSLLPLFIEYNIVAHAKVILHKES